MSRLVVAGHEQLIVHVPNFKDFAARVPEFCNAFLECTVYVNQRSFSVLDETRLVLIPE